MQLHHQKRLNCLVFDEVHKVSTDGKYREAFNAFWVLNLVSLPIIGLSGSIPPSTVDELVRLTNTTWRIVRTPSNRPELAYSVKHVSGDIADQILKDVPAYLNDYSPADRLMIFCRSHSEVEQLSSALGVTGITSRSAETNDEAMQKWRSGTQKVMVSTSLLGCGLDYASVRHVIHCGIAYSMIDQHQQESRAGRDGKRAMAITYARPTIRRTSKAPDDAYGLPELEDWAASSNECLRVIPSSYLDGVPVTCLLLPNAELCSYCEEQAQHSPPARAATLSKYIRDAVSNSKAPVKRLGLQRPPYVFVPPPKTPASMVILQSSVSTPDI